MAIDGLVRGSLQRALTGSSERGRWAGPLSDADDSVLAHAVPAVLDIGCGPARHTLALSERGFVALGIDITPSALRIARERGATVLERSVFDRIPGAGRWETALLLDGNLGIGGDPIVLLRRVRRLLAPGGRVLVETEAPGSEGFTDTARLVVDGEPGPWFPWTAVAADDLGSVAESGGFICCEQWSFGDRWFARLESVNT